MAYQHWFGPHRVMQLDFTALLWPVGLVFLFSFSNWVVDNWNYLSAPCDNSGDIEYPRICWTVTVNSELDKVSIVR